MKTLMVYYRCAACGCRHSRDWPGLNSALADIAQKATSPHVAEARTAMICPTCEADPQTAHAKLTNPEEGMPIGAMPFTVGELKFVRLVMEKFEGHGTVEQQEFARRILAVVNPALASVEGQARTLGVQVTDRINALIEQEGIQRVPKP